MDRSRKDELPKMQVGFISFVCLPLYQVCVNNNYTTELHYYFIFVRI